LKEIGSSHELRLLLFHRIAPVPARLFYWLYSVCKPITRVSSFSNHETRRSMNTQLTLRHTSRKVYHSAAFLFYTFSNFPWRERTPFWA
jgi:hypothetical protein